ncbi:MAG: SPOR domain-containing protein [Acidobacteriota bacterium]|nr:MAG: SPOR domain-containing protein [Acidobacteriota bacterium]
MIALCSVVQAQRVKYTVQLEATSILEVARDKAGRFKDQGLDVYIVRSEVPGKGTFYRIRTGVFPSQQVARNYGADLKRRGVVPDYFIAPYEEPRNDWMGVKPVEKKPEAPVKAASAAPSEPPPARIETKPAEPAPSDISIPETGTTVSFSVFRDPSFGFSLEHPKYWEGGPFSPNDLASQKIDAGAMFKSYQDASFLNIIWNNLDKANSPDNDNDLIVEVILKSMGAGEGTQKMNETSRKVVTEAGAIKTMLELQATFQTKGQEEPLDFLGKAVIIRASKGILLVVAFYSKQSQPYVARIADRIISSVRVPN